MTKEYEITIQGIKIKTGDYIKFKSPSYEYHCKFGYVTNEGRELWSDEWADENSTRYEYMVVRLIQEITKITKQEYENTKFMYRTGIIKRTRLQDS